MTISDINDKPSHIFLRRLVVKIYILTLHGSSGDLANFLYAPGHFQVHYE